MSWQPPDEIHVRKRFAGAIFFAVAGSALAGFATVERDCIFFAAPLYGFAVLAWSLTVGGFTLRFHYDCIEHQPSGLRVPYDAISFLKLSNREVLDAKTALQAKHMLIGHPGGCWRLPQHAPISRRELYRYLLGKSRLLEPPSHFPGRLREVFDREVADFGAEQVLATRGRGVSDAELPQPQILMFVFLVLAAATALAAFCKASEGTGITLGIATGTMFLFTILHAAARRGQRSGLRKIRAASGLVISPRGLTMETPVIKGALGWAEVKGVVVLHRGSAILSGLILKIEGGQILVGDHFVCPLTEIHRRIEANLAHERR
jgi:hypothetical protein